MRLIRLALCLGLLLGQAGLALAVPNAYVLDFLGNVRIVDTAPNTLVPNTLAVGKEAWSLAISPDGSRVYTYNTDNPPNAQITIIDAANNTIIPPTVSVPCTFDSWITISPDGAFLYIACNNPTPNVLVFDTGTNSVLLPPISIPGGAFTDLVTNQTGTRLYVADHGNSVIQVIDTTNPVSPVVLTPFSSVDSSGATGIAFSNSQNRLYVPRPNAPNFDLLAIDVGTGSGTPIAVPGRHVSTNPSGTRVYLLDNLSGNVTAIDTASNAILGAFNGSSGVYSSAVHPTNERIYVLNQALNNIQVFDPNAPVFSPVTTVNVNIPPGSFIEPRINGRWMGPAPPAPVPALSTVGSTVFCLMLLMVGIVMRRRMRHG